MEWNHAEAEKVMLGNEPEMVRSSNSILKRKEQVAITDILILAVIANNQGHHDFRLRNQN